MVLEFKDRQFIAKKIKSARKKANLTQSELAEKIGISSKQLSRIEMASFIPSLMTFLKILKVLEMDLKDFDIVIRETTNELKDSLIRVISCATDKELKLYHELINVLIKNSIQA